VEKEMGPLELTVVGRISIEIQRVALPHPRGSTAALPEQQDLATNYVTLSISDMDTYPPYIMTRNK
jgi:hypothetical protein